MKRSYTTLLMLFLLACFNTANAQAPVITSFSPNAGPVGALVTITGSGFNATPANNIVYFGAVQAAVNSATPTQLVVTAPVGATYKPIRVTNTATYLQGISNVPFILKFTTNGNIPVPLNTPAVSGNRPALSDIDGDGKVDYIGMSYDSMLVYINTTVAGSNTATFKPSVNFSVGLAHPQFFLLIETGDINGDGKTDVVTTYGSSSIAIFINTSTVGHVSFAGPKVISIADCRKIWVLDFDGDGRADVGVLHKNEIRIFRNTATVPTTVSFASPAVITFLVNFPDCNFGDMDGDNKPDLLVTNSAGDAGKIIRIYKNKTVSGSITTASFNSSVDIISPHFMSNITTADIDGDGKLDILTDMYEERDDEQIGVFRNTATSGNISSNSFATPVLFPKPYQALWMQFAEMDGDGKPDIIWGSTGSGEITIYKNMAMPGSITTESFTILPTIIPGDKYFDTGDINGDGRTDIITANGIAILSNTPPLVKPSITNVSSAKAQVGTTITITGSNFSANAVDNVVYFGAVQAQVTYASATRLSVTVPAGATYSPITVLNKVLSRSATSPGYFIATLSPAKARILKTDYSLLAHLSITSTGMPNKYKVMDLNSDGKPDIVALNNESIDIFANTTGAGSTAFTTTKLRAFEDVIDVGDIDNDGKPDMITSGWDDYSGHFIFVHRNISSGATVSFAKEVLAGFVDDYLPYPGKKTSNLVKVADLDGDGRNDIVGQDSHTFKNLSYNGNMTRDTFTEQSGWGWPYTADFNEDGKVDGFMFYYGKIAIQENYLKPGYIGYKVTDPIYVGKMDYKLDVVAAGDVTGDGKIDIVTSSSANNKLYVYPNASANGKVVFKPGISMYTPFKATHISIGDINGDGKADLVISSGTSTYVVTNNSVSGILAPNQFTVERLDIPSISNAIADFDGDGRPDLLLATTTSIDVYKYDPANAAPGIANQIVINSAVSPNGDGVNDVFTINGIDQYPDNKVLITNSRGATVFEAAGYNNSSKAFNGISNTGAKQQPGTYFYTLEYNDKGVKQHKSGYIVLQY